MKVRFASFLSGGFTIMAVINPPERKLAKRTSVQWATPLLGVPHWLMILEYTLEEQEIGAIVGQTVTLIYMVKFGLFEKHT